MTTHAHSSGGSTARRRLGRSFSTLLLLSVAAVCFSVAPAAAQLPPPAAQGSTPQRARTDVNVDEHLGQGLPLDLPFVAADGSAVTLRDYWSDGKPVIVVLAYYECPMLCTRVLNALQTSLTGILPDDALGRDFRIVTVSINPKEGPALATEKHGVYCEGYEAEASENWVFLTGEEDNIKALADGIGFRYFFDTRLDQYAHPAVITITTPDARVSNYIYGIDYPPTDLRNSLQMAREGRVAGVIQRLGAQLPADLTLTTDDGQTRKLGDLYEKKKPLVIMLDYQAAAAPEGELLTGLAQMVSDDWFPVARNYRLLTVSLDPEESAEHLSARAEATRAAAKVTDPALWRFARADEASLRALAEAAGIGYTGNATDGFIYPAVILIATPDGKISSYRVDTFYQLKEFKMGLIDASRGEIGSVLDKIILSCFHYDPDSMGYVLVAQKAMRLGGVVILVFMIALLTVLWRYDARRKTQAQAAPEPTSAPLNAQDP